MRTTAISSYERVGKVAFSNQNVKEKNKRILIFEEM